MWRAAVSVATVTLIVISAIGAVGVWSDSRAGRPMYFGAGGNLAMAVTIGFVVGLLSAVTLGLGSLLLRRLWRGWSHRLQYLVGVIAGLLTVVALEALSVVGEAIWPLFGPNGFVPTLITATIVVSIPPIVVALVVGNVLHRRGLHVEPAA
jgi:drug/metabolite transporter (DMT)-like permease